MGATQVHAHDTYGTTGTHAGTGLGHSNATHTGGVGHAGTHHVGQGVTAGSSMTPGSGTAQKTAGPHNSDLLNKLDPRVDSDMDGSKTTGGNKTFT